MGPASESRVEVLPIRPEYTICGVETPIARALASLLNVFGCRKAENPQRASISILDHRENFELGPEVLRFYHDGLGGGPKHLLYSECRSVAHQDVPIRDGEGPSWLSTITDPCAVVPTIAHMCDVNSIPSEDLLSPPSPSQCTSVVEQILPKSKGAQDSEWIAFLKDRAKVLSCLTERGHDRTLEDSSAYYYLLACITENFPTRDHDEKKHLDEHLFGAAIQLQEVLKKRRLVQMAEDLRASLAYRLLPPTDGRDCILLVDDSPEEYTPALRAICEVFMPEYSILSCKLDSTHIRTLQLLSRYRSGIYTTKSLDDELSKLPLEYVAGRHCGAGLATLDSTKLKLRFILMDQMFKTSRRGGEMLGPSLTKGLIRLIKDLQAREEGGKQPPELIAVSRSEDPQVVQSALRAGASDYVFKSRLLSLPSVLARLQVARSDAPHRLHRTFRILSRLPNETAGLLQSIRIPRIALHRSLSDPSNVDPPGGPARYKPLPCAKEIAELLSVLPKPDLHVHLGSCMSTEFLVVASLIGLLRHDRICRKPSAFQEQLAELVKLLHRLRKQPEMIGALTFIKEISPNPNPARESNIEGVSWIGRLAGRAKEHLKHHLEAADPERRSAFRAVLHSELGIPDYLDESAARGKLDKKPALDLALFAIRYLDSIGASWKSEDIVRIYLLTLATDYTGAGLRMRTGIAGAETDHDFLTAFSHDTDANRVAKLPWRELRHHFYSSCQQAKECEGASHSLSTEHFRHNGWRWKATQVPIQLDWPGGAFDHDYQPRAIDRDREPIEYELATGLTSTNLVEYLQGCEFSGAEHMRHPFLIHLYAHHTVLQFIRKGVFYAELKGSPDGFVSPEADFEFSNVCRCLVEAFSQAQALVAGAYREVQELSDQTNTHDALWIGDVLGKRFSLGTLQDVLRQHESQSLPITRLPCKVSLIFVGKRHKTTREMILEAAAVAMMRPAGEESQQNAGQFAEAELRRCRVVGFDLAGREFDHPPELFAEEFSRLSRLHVPFTVHAGENAPAQFIEDAIVLLQARRIGHGLALTEDRGLLARVREDRVCIELCPVCNHQTSHFLPPDSTAQGRRYPLKELLDRGIYATINTDNPIISSTNLVREYFQASYAYDQRGLTLWEALRLMRMGFVCSFLNLSERRAMLEMAEQFLFDLFSSESCLRLLREVAASQHASEAKLA